MNILNKFFLVLLLVEFDLILLSQTITGDSTYIKKAGDFFSDSTWKGAIIGFTAKDITNNKLLLDVNGFYKLNPASITKLITTSASLHILGEKYSFKTEFGYTGYIKDSVLYGNIIIKGYGDPTLYSKRFKWYFKKVNPFDSVIFFLQKKGIKEIKGKVIGDETFFKTTLIPNYTWLISDIGNYFGAKPSALTIYDNEYSLYFSTKDTSKTVNLIAIFPPELHLKIINNLKAANISDDQSVIFSNLFDSTILITGYLPVNADSFEVRGSINNPAQLAAISLKELIKKNNILINDTVLTRNEYNFVFDSTETFSLIFTHYSPDLGQIISLTNLYSINIYAENILRLCGWKMYKNTDQEISCSAVKRFWKNNIGDFILFDGSGLSRLNAISTQQFVDILDFMYNKSSYKKVFYESLPIAGESGTLLKMFAKSKAKGKIRAKTGSMTNIRSLAGYIQPDKKTTIAFCIIINNCSLPVNVIKQKIEQIILQLFF